MRTLIFLVIFALVCAVAVLAAALVNARQLLGKAAEELRRRRP